MIQSKGDEPYWDTLPLQGQLFLFDANGENKAKIDRLPYRSWLACGLAKTTADPTCLFGYRSVSPWDLLPHLVPGNHL